MPIFAFHFLSSTQNMERARRVCDIIANSDNNGAGVIHDLEWPEATQARRCTRSDATRDKYLLSISILPERALYHTNLGLILSASRRPTIDHPSRNATPKHIQSGYLSVYYLGIPTCNNPKICDVAYFIPRD
ncbi:unnamed protein product [Pieris macdunnoughi]|uniref:Uncharacterized protein n=1 Tax=Pieris macdunnoughi TaxID=345717 RepID=A0A821P1C8_9NEOP|nr:unnamed protein product [Pieris macdunnoughi]